MPIFRQPFVINSVSAHGSAVPFSAAHGAIRLSLSRFTTGAEIDRVLTVLPGIMADLRAMSPFWADMCGAESAAGEASC